MAIFKTEDNILYRKPGFNKEMASGRVAPSDRHVERSETSMFLSEI